MPVADQLKQRPTTKSRPAPSGIGPWLPWTDRAGRLSMLKLVVFIIVCAPTAYMQAVWWADKLPTMTTFVVKESGEWSMRFIVAAVAVSPLRRIARFNKLILVRRMLGLASLFYGFVHLWFYFTSQHYDWRFILEGALTAPFLTTGYIALLLMIVLGVTSNDLSVRKLGTNGWRRVHWIVFPAAVLSLLHFILERRTDGDEIALISGILLYLLSYRVMRYYNLPTGPIMLFLLAPLAALATVGMEGAFYKFATGVHAPTIMWLNVTFHEGLRPAWWVLFACLIIALVMIVQERFFSSAPARGERRR